MSRTECETLLTDQAVEQRILIGALERENAGLSRTIHERDQAIENHVARIALLEQHRTRRNHGAHKLVPVDLLERLPKTLHEVVGVVGRLFPDRLIFSEGALRAAGESSFRNIHVAWECLSAMATLLHDLHFREKLSFGEIASRFQAQSRFQLAHTESESTRRNKQLAALRTTVYKGVTLNASAHVKHGVSAPNCLRVHYGVYPHQEVLVIAHCGDHLDTMRSC